VAAFEAILAGAPESYRSGSHWDFRLRADESPPLERLVAVGESAR
jgi:hypothetical protein